MTPIEILHAGRALLAESPDLSSADAWLTAVKMAPRYAASPSTFGALAIIMDGDFRRFEATHSRDQVLAAWDRAIEHLQERGA